MNSNVPGIHLQEKFHKFEMHALTATMIVRMNPPVLVQSQAAF